MERVIGVLLFHCTEYGSSDFDISGCTKIILSELSLKLDKEKVRAGFIAEVKNHSYAQEENVEEEMMIEKTFYTIFEEMWDKYVK